MTTLIKYDAACRALAAAKAVDEVKDLRDKAEAMRIYGMQANNKALEVDAAEIRIRAERRLGEMLAQSDLQKGGRPTKTGADEEPVSTPTLAEAGISKKLSSRSQKLAAVPEDQFEAEVGEWRERVKAEGKRVTTRLEQAGEKAMAGKTEKPAKPDPVAKLKARVAELEAEIQDLRDRYNEQGQNLKEALADNESMARVFEENDKLTAALAEAKRYREMNRLLEERIRGLQNEKNSAVSSAKGYKAKLEKLERAAA